MTGSTATMEPRVFGNTLYSLRGAALLTCVIAVLVAVCIYFMAPTTGSASSRAMDSAKFGMGILALVAGIVLPTCLFSLRVDDTHITHLLGGKIELSRKPLADLHSLEVGRLLGATLRFRDGSSIRFPGARLEFLRDLCLHLRERCGDALRVQADSRVAALLAMGGRPRRHRGEQD